MKRKHTKFSLKEKLLGFGNSFSKGALVGGIFSGGFGLFNNGTLAGVFTSVLVAGSAAWGISGIAKLGLVTRRRYLNSLTSKTKKLVSAMDFALGMGLPLAVEISILETAEQNKRDAAPPKASNVNVLLSSSKAVLTQAFLEAQKTRGAGEVAKLQSLTTASALRL